MSNQYSAPLMREDIAEEFGAKPPKVMWPAEMTPGEQGVFIRRHPDADVLNNSVVHRQALLGRFALATPWAQDEVAEYKYLAVACGEKLSDSKVFSELWRKGQRCIIPATSFPKKMYYKRRKPESTIVSKSPFGSFGIAGLWSEWKNKEGVSKFSYAMLSVAADSHPLMRHFRYRDTEIRMPLIVPEDQYGAWLNDSREECLHFIFNFPLPELKVAPPFKEYLLDQEL